MKRSVVLIVLTALALAVNAATHVVGTYNIRIATKRDVGDKNWAVRKPFVVQTITDNRLDIVSLNEIANHHQEDDLRTLLPDYTLVAYGRESAASSHGERVGVLFKTAKYTLLDSGHFFLTENPDLPGLAWDAAYKRVAVWVLLQDKHSREELLVMSTHLDYKGTEARCNGAALCIERAKALAQGRTAIIMGDLNAEPYETDVHSLFADADFHDARQISRTKPRGTYGTFSNWLPVATTQRIDFIYVRNASVRSYRVIAEDYGRPLLPSDHRLVVIKMTSPTPSERGLADKVINDKLTVINGE